VFLAYSSSDVTRRGDRRRRRPSALLTWFSGVQGDGNVAAAPEADPDSVSAKRRLFVLTSNFAVALMPNVAQQTLPREQFLEILEEFQRKVATCSAGLD